MRKRLCRRHGQAQPCTCAMDNLYRLTPQGERHLDEWVTVLGQVSTAMSRFIRQAERGSSCQAATQVDAAR